VYVDEFQSFTTLAVTTILSDLRKYRVGMTVAHQYLYRSSPSAWAPKDTGYISRELNERFEFSDLTNLENHRVAVTHMIDG
jgi:hypothetical protein